MEAVYRLSAKLAFYRLAEASSEALADGRAEEAEMLEHLAFLAAMYEEELQALAAVEKYR